MGLAYEILAGKVTNTGAGTLTALTMATGNSLTIRHVSQGASIRLESINRDGATAGAVQVVSPLMHDQSWGITLPCPVGARGFLLPREVGAPLTDADTLIVKADSGAADSTVVTLGVYYSDLMGAAARLFMWGDISGIIKSIKVVHVNPTNSATVGAWKDTLITNDEDVLHAKSDYAVLGYITDSDVAAVAIMGQATSNLRCGGPGPTTSLDTSEYFVHMSEKHGTPHIPVFNGDDRGSLYVSTVDKTASTTPKLGVILAELTQTLPQAA